MSSKTPKVSRDQSLRIALKTRKRNATESLWRHLRLFWSVIFKFDECEESVTVTKTYVLERRLADTEIHMSMDNSRKNEM
jgi:hypothetical protein